MKKLTISIVTIVLFFSCSKKNETSPECPDNKVVLLKVDFLTHTFEGGKELTFRRVPTFTISSNFQPPGDFGSVQLYYDEVNELLFDGTIIWMGTGQMSYPDIENPSVFSTIGQTVPMPDTNLFEKVMYDQFAYYPETIPYQEIWDAIGNLGIVEEYRNFYPLGKVHLFLYTPSVGYGNPADWDWFVILKN